MKNNFKQHSFLKRLSYAARGIFGALKRESSFQIQCICALALLVFCLVVRPSLQWCAIFTVTSAVVLGLEMMNTALESILDKLHPEEHAEIGFAKDCLAGAVLFASIGAVIVFAIFIVSKFS